MRPTLYLGLIATALWLQGCAQSPGDPKTAPTFWEKADTQRCDSNGNCKMSIWARVDASGKCEVKPQYKDVYVGKGYAPKMTWEIETDNSAKDHDFKFELEPTTSPARYGIEILKNDPAVDFDDPDYGKKLIFLPDNQKFKWQNKHLRKGEFDYNIHVLYRPKGQEKWTSCSPVDPRIINEW